MTFVFAAGPCDGAAREESTAALPEVEQARQAMTTAAESFDEIAFLLRRMRSIAVASSGGGSGSQTRLWQEQLHTLVGQVAAATAKAVVAGVPIFSGGWSFRSAPVGAARQPVDIDIAPLNTRLLRIERPWGYATRAKGPPARLIAATGVIPDGVFMVRRGDVVDVAGVPVGTVQGRQVEFNTGARATFDRSPSYRDDESEPASGCLTLSSVLSVRSPSAAGAALDVIGDAVAEVSRRREALNASRHRFEDVVSTWGERRMTGISPR